MDDTENQGKISQLSDKEALRIKRIASALNKTDGWESDVSSHKGDSSHKFIQMDSMASGATDVAAGDVKVSRVFHFSATLPDAMMTIINDLQGLDQALFRIKARNVVSGGKITMEFNALSQSLSMQQSDTKFDMHLNSIFQAEYFDASTNFWEPLLLSPWEMTLNTCRGKDERYKSRRMTTMTDIEANSCSVSFSEQFLVSLGATNKMWKMYAAATENAVLTEEDPIDQPKSSSKPKKKSKKRTDSASNGTKSAIVKKSMAANAARAFVTSMPYGINNRCGVKAYFTVKSADSEQRVCPPGSIQHFRFEWLRSEGVGGKRVYGQDVKQLKSLYIYIEDKMIVIKHLDAEVNQPRRAHELGPGRIVFTDVVKTGKATILNIFSHVHIYNSTNLPFDVAVVKKEGVCNIGVCHGKTSSGWQRQKKLKSTRRSSITASKPTEETLSSKLLSSLGIPIDLLHAFDSTQAKKSKPNAPTISIVFCPRPQDNALGVKLETVPDHGEPNWGSLPIPPLDVLTKIAKSNKQLKMTEIICGTSLSDMLLKHRRSHEEQDAIMKRMNSFCIQVCIKVSLVDNFYPFVEVFLQPRSIIENKLPISIKVRTPMPFTYSIDIQKNIVSSGDEYKKSGGQVVHRLDPNQVLEIFTPGPSIAVSVGCADSPHAGPTIGWLEGEWIDIPLGRSRRLAEVVRCVFPFLRKKDVQCPFGGIEFFLAEAETMLSGAADNLTNPKGETRPTSKDDPPPPTVHRTPQDLIRTLCVTLQNYAVDYVENLLFEPVHQGTGYLGTNMSLTSKSASPNEAPVLPWSAFTCPFRGRRITLLPGSTVPIRLIELTIERAEGMKRSLPFRIDEISICDGGVESSAIVWDDNTPTGYYAYRQLKNYNQCEIRIIPEFIVFNGDKLHTIVVKQSGDKNINLKPQKIAPVVSDPERGLIIMIEIPGLAGSTAPIRVDLLGMKIIVVSSNLTGAPLGSLAVQTVVGAKDSRLVVKIGSIRLGDKESTRDENQKSFLKMFANDFLRLRVRWSKMQVTLNDTEQATAIAQIRFDRMTVDYQRIFKDQKTQTLESPERSQLAIIIHDMKLVDCDEKSTNPIVLKSYSNHSFMELYIRFIGDLNAEIVKVELVDLNFAYSNKKSDTIVINTGEAFIWRLLDVAHRVLEAISEMTGVHLILDWDEESGEYLIKVEETQSHVVNDEDSSVIYKPPRSDKLFDIKMARVSPINLLVTFQRQPEALRYKRISGTRGAKLMNYFMQRLKFTVDKADIKFNGLVARNVKGPPDRVVEMFKTVYISRIKSQMFKLMTAVSIQDWRYLTDRQEGADEYIEGDILRMTGNLLGRSAGYVLKHLGQGVGDGVITATSTIGNGFQSATEMIGIGVVGAGVNSVVSGLGSGVSDSVKGVTKGAGNIIRGTSRGVGHIFGGVGGGALIVAKGVSKGVITADGEAIIKGVNDGFTTAGTGVAQGVGNVATGAADGVMHAGKGLFSGLRSVGTGIGEAFTGGKKKDEKPPSKSMTPKK